MVKKSDQKQGIFCLNARPHPGPLPQERGKRLPLLGIDMRLGWSSGWGGQRRSYTPHVPCVLPEAGNIGLNARPHPCPLPQERGKRLPLLGIDTRLGWSSELARQKRSSTQLVPRVLPEAGNIGLNAHPHPCPLPQERGKRLPLLGIDTWLGWSSGWGGQRRSYTPHVARVLPVPI